MIGEQFGVGHALRVRFENLPAGHFLARHAERDERLFVWIDRAIRDRRRDRRQVVDADRRQLAVAADAPVQIFLQLHDGDEARFVDRRQRHHGAGDERPVASICRSTDLSTFTVEARRLGRRTSAGRFRCRACRAARGPGRRRRTGRADRPADRAASLACCRPA